MESIIDLKEPFLLERVFGPYAEKTDFFRHQYEYRLRPSGHTAEAIKAWIEGNVREWSLSPTTWAKRAGIAPSTLNRFIDGQDENKNLSAKTIDRLSKVVEEEINKRASDEWSEFEDQSSNSGYDINYADLLGTIGGDAWNTRRKPTAEDEAYGAYPELVIPSPKSLARYKLAAFEIITDRHAPIFSKNETLICEPICRTKSIPSSNQYVVLIQADENGRWKAVLKQFVLDPTGRHWLVPVGKQATSDEQAIYIDSHANPDGTEIKITFNVVGAHRHLTPAGG